MRNPIVMDTANFTACAITSGSWLLKDHILFNVKLKDADIIKAIVLAMYLLSFTFSLNKYTEPKSTINAENPTTANLKALAISC